MFNLVLHINSHIYSKKKGRRSTVREVRATPPRHARVTNRPEHISRRRWVAVCLRRVTRALILKGRNILKAFISDVVGENICSVPILGLNLWPFSASVSGAVIGYRSALVNSGQTTSSTPSVLKKKKKGHKWVEMEALMWGAPWFPVTLCI